MHVEKRIIHVRASIVHVAATNLQVSHRHPCREGSSSCKRAASSCSHRKTSHSRPPTSHSPTNFTSPKNTQKSRTGKPVRLCYPEHNHSLQRVAHNLRIFGAGDGIFRAEGVVFIAFDDFIGISRLNGVVIVHGFGYVFKAGLLCAG